MQNATAQQQTVLLIDDDPDTLLLTTRLLTSAGYTVLETMTGAEGLRLAHAQQPDIILLDVMLPDMDGRDLCRQLKRDPDLPQSFVVLISNVKIASDEQAAGLEHGADGYIVRPIANRELLARVAAFARIKQAEKALRESEARFRAIFDASVDAIGVAKAGVHLYVNQAYLDLFGYAFSGELIGTSIYQLLAADQQSKIADYTDRRSRGERAPACYESRGVKQDGSEFDIEVHVSTYTLNEEFYEQVIIRDISERKLIERAQMFLLECGWSTVGEDFFAALARFLAETLDADYVCIDRLAGDHLSASTVAIYFDGQYEENVSYTLKDTPCADVVGKTICCFPAGVRYLFPQDAVLQEMCAESYAGTTLWSADGQPIGLIAVIGRQPLANPRLAETILNLVAIRAAGELERKQAEETLRRAKEEWELTFDAVPDLIALVDTNHRILRTNRAMAERLPCTPEQAMGSPCYEVVHGLSAPPTFCPHTQLLQTSSEASAEVTEERLGGTFDVRVTPLHDQTGTLIGSVHIAHDISERKRAEEERQRLQAELLQSQKMESVGRLAGGVAHDFNNMLGVILGYTELAMLKTDPTLPLHADLAEIRKAAERSAELTRQLLAFARKQTVTPKVLDLNETITGMLKMLRRLIGEDIHLVWSPGRELWPVMIDPAQVDQILANLCVNARDAITGVGKITIETHNIVCDEAYSTEHAGIAPGAYVQLAISDTGCGMDAETQSNIFEPFFTTKRVGGGTGLGLATVYGVVTQNQGFINVYSELGHGATFKVYLPRHIGHTTQLPEDTTVKPGRLGHETILLVEDELSILSLGRRILEQQGYQVLAAGTPVEAINLARAHSGEIHLLVTDVIMPEMNGRDLARRLLTIYPDMKRLFMSGYTADVIAHHGVLDEGVNFLQKPFTIHDLAFKVREILDQ